MRIQTIAMTTLLAATLGCDTGSRHGLPIQPAFSTTTSTASIGSGTPGTGTTGGNNGGNGGGFNGAGLITGLTPVSGSALGDTAVTIRGQGFVPGSTVEFDGVAAAQVNVLSADTIECRSPAHAPALIDVTVSDPTGAQIRLNNAFTFDPSGALARVADYGDPSGGEQELLELMNRARNDPVAEGGRLGLDFSAYQKRPPLSHNAFLHQAAVGHTTDMIGRGFYGHVNPDGDNANGRILDTNYDLNGRYPTSRTVNLTENIGAGSGNLFNTPQKVHDLLMADQGVNPPKHREAMLGHGTFLGANRESGLGFRVNQPSATGFEHHVTEEFALTKRDRPFLLGVAYSDTSPDGIARSGEGLAGRTVTLSHVSGFTISTTTMTQGGFAFEVFVDDTFTLTIDGQSTQVQINGANVKVDLRDGQIVTN